MFKQIAPESRLVKPVGRPRVHKDDATRQAAYRARVSAKSAQQSLDLKEARELLQEYISKHP